MANEVNAIWIDANIDNYENREYTKELCKINSLKLKLFKNVNEAITYIKSIKFKETKVIISGRLYSEFVKAFKNNIIYIYTIIKIIVFTSNEQGFLEYNKDYYNNANKFYNYGGIAISFEQIKEFLNIDNKKKEKGYSIFSEKISEIVDDQIIFEYIDNKEKLLLPLFFKTLPNNITNEDIEKYNKFLFKEYSQENPEYKELLISITSISNIPKEVLSKYYVRLLSIVGNFIYDLNNDLSLNQKEKYLPFIQILYEGIKLNSLPLSSDNQLYFGTNIINNEIYRMKDNLNKKIKGFSKVILFSKSFLFFTKNENKAKEHINIKEKDKNSTKVLFVLERDENLDYIISTHADLKKIDYYHEGENVLFFPFSSFEIKEIKNIYFGKERGYEIKLLYLSKYLKDIENDKSIILNENKIPDTLFKKELYESGIIKKDIFDKINNKMLYNNYKQSENEFNNNNINNIILGEINISSDDINKDIQIINSLENSKKIKEFYGFKDELEYLNEQEIKENTEIKINGKKIAFSYIYKFEKEGKYKIEYIFKKNLSKINHMFYKCCKITSLDFSNFNTQNIINMGYLFYDCNSLTNLNLSNFNTRNVTDMSFMCYGCNSLINLDLSSFNTQSVTDMSFMFWCCKSLLNINLSSFSSQNVINMGNMFCCCESLISLDLSGFKCEKDIDMICMFINCRSLKYLNILNFNCKSEHHLGRMFVGCDSLKKSNVIIKDKTFFLPLK